MVASVLALVVLVGGCSPSQYARQADRTAYRTLEAGQEAALGHRRAFSVSYVPYVSSPQAPTVIRVGDRAIVVRPAGAAGGGAPASEPAKAPASGPAEQFGDLTVEPSAEGRAPAGPPTDDCMLGLNDSLDIAFHGNRAFQTRKEELYVQGLALANAARAWNWTLWQADVSAAASHIRTNEVGETNAGAASVGPTLTQKFRNGGVLTLGAPLAWASNFSGIHTTDSQLEAQLSQPLVRGAWRDFAYEPQYRLERDFIFAVFDYERYTQTFAVGVVSGYYAVLQLRDRLENDRANIKRLEQTFRWTRVMVESGQASLIEQDQSEQDLLQAQVRLQQDRQAYQDAMDRFKVQTLALPVGACVQVDYPAALEALRVTGPLPVLYHGQPLEESQAIEIALSVRPDVLTQGALVRDAERNVEIAADQFNPSLDLTLGISAESKPPDNFWDPQFRRHTRSAGVTFEYPLNQTDNRDVYRRALISQDRVRRDYAQFIDQVKIDVRDAYRALDQSRKSYELQLRSVQINVRRSKLAAMQQREGLASARDVLEAEDALRNAQNGLTSALINYTTTRLSFLATLGMLWVDDQGVLHEQSEPFTFDRIARRYPYVRPK